MIRHVVLFRWKPGTPVEARRSIRSELAALPDSIAEIRELRLGDDAGLAEGNFDFALVVDFADADAYRAYAAHPEHRRVVDERIRPHLDARVAVQHEL